MNKLDVIQFFVFCFSIIYYMFLYGTAWLKCYIGLPSLSHWICSQCGFHVSSWKYLFSVGCWWPTIQRSEDCYFLRCLQPCINNWWDSSCWAATRSWSICVPASWHGPSQCFVVCSLIWLSLNVSSIYEWITGNTDVFQQVMLQDGKKGRRYW